MDSSSQSSIELLSSKNGGSSAASFYSASSTPLNSPDFEFSSRSSLSSGDDAMSSAADLFVDGKIRSLRLFSAQIPPPQVSNSGGVRADVIRSVSAKEIGPEGEKSDRSWRWGNVKEIMYRSRSEGRGRTVKDEEKKVVGRRRNGGGGFVSLHEMHYTEKRAHAEEMKRKTYLPYRQGLLGCLGFTWRSCGAIHGFSRAFTQTSVFSR